MNSLRQALVLAEQEADFAAAHADVAGRHVRVRADVAEQFGHERLAEAHDFVVGFALGIEVRAALAAAHGQGGERVLEDLLEGEELQDAGADGGMKAQAALVRSDGAVQLDAEAAVDLDLALVVLPGNAEDELPLRFDDPLQDPPVAVFLVPSDGRLDGLEHFGDGLQELRFVGVASSDDLEGFLDDTHTVCLLFWLIRDGGALRLARRQTCPGT